MTSEDSGKIKEVVELSEEEVAQRSQTLAAKTKELEIAKNDLKEASSSARAAIKALQATVNELADQVSTRTQTRYVDRQPGLFGDSDSPDDDEEGNPTDAEGEDGAPEAEAGEVVSGSPGTIKGDPKWSEGANPGPVPADAEITDPSRVMGPALPPEAGTGKRKKGGKGSHAAH